MWGKERGVGNGEVAEDGAVGGMKEVWEWGRMHGCMEGEWWMMKGAVRMEEKYRGTEEREKRKGREEEDSRCGSRAHQCTSSTLIVNVIGCDWPNGHTHMHTHRGRRGKERAREREREKASYPLCTLNLASNLWSLSVNPFFFSKLHSSQICRFEKGQNYSYSFQSVEKQNEMNRSALPGVIGLLSVSVREHGRQLCQTAFLLSRRHSNGFLNTQVQSLI